MFISPRIWKRFHRVAITTVLTLALLVSLLPAPLTGWTNNPPTALANTKPTVNIGDYIRIGRYYDEPILWRVIHKDANGDPLLLADRILSIKSFDAAGSYHAGDTDRVQFGSNFYLDSNIRQWLNSSSPNSGSSKIDWIQNDPSEANMWSGYNPYSEEKGFLADGNFTATERSYLKPLTHKVLLSGADAPKTEGGSAVHQFDYMLSNVVRNYDTTAYFRTVTDNVFLLSVKQLKEHVFDNSATLDANYHVARPTAAAVANSIYKNEQFLSSSTDWYYYLNTPYGNSSYGVRGVYEDGTVSIFDAYDVATGIRPALQLTLTASMFSAGSGTSANPYVVNRTPAADTQAPTAPTNLQATNVTATGLTLTWNASTDNFGVDAYQVFSGATRIATVSTLNPATGAPVTSITVNNLMFDTSYTFTVRAVDLAGNLSASSTSLTVKTTATPAINIGDYVQFGKYNNESILWRVIHKDGSGDPVLLADRILSIKAFDAAGSAHSGNANRTNRGSNMYLHSNLRQWLNSSSPNNDTNRIDWVQNDPTAGNIDGDHNPYSTEKGFLADGNFTDAERQLIKPLTHRVALAGVDAAVRDGGIQNLLYDPNIATTMQNYDTAAHFKNATDRVFLLSVKQVKEWVFDNSGLLGPNYHLARPTAAAVSESTFSDGNLTALGNWSYWLNTPNAFNSHELRLVNRSGLLTNNVSAHAGNMGVRPALTVSLSGATFALGGLGTAGSPFVITGGPTPPPDSQLPGMPKNVTADQVGAKSVKLSWSKSDDAYGIAGYEVYQNNQPVTYVTGKGPDEPPTTMTVSGLDDFTAYNFSVKAVDRDGFVSKASAVLKVTTLDRTAPSVPSWLSPTQLATNAFKLNWTVSTDNDQVSGYDVYLNDQLLTTVTDSEYTLSGLTNNTTFRVALRSKDASGNVSAASNTLVLKTTAGTGGSADTQNPTRPTALAAENITSIGLQLKWAAATDNVGVTGYDIYQNNALISSVLSGVTSYDVKGLSPGTSYMFYVQARDAAGNVSAASDTVSVATLPQADSTAPTAPSGLTASLIGFDRALLTWQPATDNVGVSAYEVYRNGSLVATVAGAVTNYIFSGLNVSTNFTLTVRARDSAGNLSEAASSVLLTTGAAPDTVSPTAPANVQATNVSHSGLLLSWNASTDNVSVTGYDVFQNGVLAATVWGARTYFAGGLSPTTNVAFTVRARDAAGNVSSSSAVLTVRTAESPELQPPTVPSALGALDLAPKSLTLAWKASTDNVRVTAYELYQENVMIAVVPGSATSSGIKGLEPNKVYSFSVRARDAAGNTSARSEPLLILTPAEGDGGSGENGGGGDSDTIAPIAPTKVRSGTVTATSVSVLWDAASDNEGVTTYEVYRGETLVRSVPAGVTTLSVTGLLPGTNYVFSVRAKDAAGNVSAESNVLRVQTKSTMDVVGKTISINGKQLNLGVGVEPVTVNGTIMVPFRPIFEALGLSVSFNATTKVIEGSRTGYRLRLQLDSRTATVNGTMNKTMPVAPTGIRGTTMVPLRFIGEELGLTVTYRAR